MSLLFLSFVAGIVSFLSPCVLPLIPGYLSFICGTDLEKLQEKSKYFILEKSLLFVLGFSIVFILLGASSTFFGSLLLNKSHIFSNVIAIIIIFFGLYLLGIVKFNFLNNEFKFYISKYSNSFFFPLVVGMGFAFGWTPCIGPILGSILALASLENTLIQGIFLLITYSIGLGIPFVLSGYYMGNFLIFSKKARKFISNIQKISGLILIVTGILILTSKLQSIGFYLLEALPFLGKLG
ncbi:cytochrome c biogenesis protein CcdA [Pelagibacteraceae bacterium]|nr:cytochrome c biogenesis protein CcdA [Pelagibacteraceae bacterium]